MVQVPSMTAQLYGKGRLRHSQEKMEGCNVH